MIKSDGMLDVMFEETGALTFALLGNRAIGHTWAASTNPTQISGFTAQIGKCYQYPPSADIHITTYEILKFLFG
jgi:hypothetical protein